MVILSARTHTHTRNFCKRDELERGGDFELALATEILINVVHYKANKNDITGYRTFFKHYWNVYLLLKSNLLRTHKTLY